MKKPIDPEDKVILFHTDAGALSLDYIAKLLSPKISDKVGAAMIDHLEAEIGLNNNAPEDSTTSKVQLRFHVAKHTEKLTELRLQVENMEAKFTAM